MSGLYNMIMGYNPACIYFLPMLDRKPDDYPRFRDCFISDDNKRIVIYTRVGGGNRNCGFGEDKLYKDPNYVTTYDDDFDSTYGNYEFNVPEKWQKDFDAILEGEFDKVSDEYKKQVKKIFPDIDVEQYFTLADGTTEQEHEDEFKVWVDKMPEDCFDCPCDSDYCICNLTGDEINYDAGRRRDDCPLKLISEYAKEQEHEHTD